MVIFDEAAVLNPSHEEACHTLTQLSRDLIIGHLEHRDFDYSLGTRRSTRYDEQTGHADKQLLR